MADKDLRAKTEIIDILENITSFFNSLLSSKREWGFKKNSQKPTQDIYRAFLKSTTHSNQ